MNSTHVAPRIGDLSHTSTCTDTIEGGTTCSCESCTAARAPKCDACDEPIWPGPQAEHAVTIGRESLDTGLWHVHVGCAPSHVLRCAWEVWDAPGGPEEGGWTFEVGVLVAAVPVPLGEASAGNAMMLGDELLAPVDALLERAFVFDGRRRLSLTFELSMPAPSFPESTPRYE